MTAGTGSHPNDPHVEAPGGARQVTPPSAARALSTLCHVGYEDAFLAGTGPAQDRTGGQWARAILANAAIPPAQQARRVQVPSGFSLFPGDIIRPPRAWAGAHGERRARDRASRARRSSQVSALPALSLKPVESYVSVMHS